MDGIINFLSQMINPESIIHYGGIYLLLFVIFAETGLFVGFFLPGDSLLFTAGLLCSAGILQIDILLLVGLIIIAAVIGNMVGYVFGKKVGPLLFTRKSGFFFRREQLIDAHAFYLKHGGKTIIIGRFLPIIRTFAPIVAGIIMLEYKKFIMFSLSGATFWVSSFVLTGYFLGKHIPGIENYLEYIVIFLIVIPAIPFLYRSFKIRKP